MYLNHGGYIIRPVRFSPQVSPCGICDEVALVQLFPKHVILHFQHYFINARYPYSIRPSLTVSLQELTASLHTKKNSPAISHDD